jgi:hypothetical protein
MVEIPENDPCCCSCHEEYLSRDDDWDDVDDE